MTKQNLAGLDRDIQQALGRVIQEAFKHGIDCDFITNGGLLAGGSEQGIYEVSSEQNYDLGARLLKKDGRVFYYSKVGPAGIASAQYGTGLVTGVQTQYQGYADGLRGIKGEYTITFPDTTSEENAYQGGWFDCFNDSGGDNRFWGGRIVSSTKSNGTTVTLTLEITVPETIATDDEGAATASAFSDVMIHNDGMASVVGVNPIAVAITANYYVWLQTWGPFPHVTICIDFQGGEGLERNVVFMKDGTMNGIGITDGKVTGIGFGSAIQIAGYWIAHNPSGDGYTNRTGHKKTGGLIFLTISP